MLPQPVPDTDVPHVRVRDPSWGLGHAIDAVRPLLVCGKPLLAGQKEREQDVRLGEFHEPDALQQRLAVPERPEVP